MVLQISEKKHDIKESCPSTVILFPDLIHASRELKRKRDNQFRAARSYIQIGYSVKTVRMYTKLPLKTIYALIKKIKDGKNIFI